MALWAMSAICLANFPWESILWGIPWSPECEAKGGKRPLSWPRGLEVKIYAGIT